jgi:SAM-dependent methyltransferase
MPTLNCETPVDFRTRIYENYFTQSVRLGEASVASAVRIRTPHIRSIVEAFFPRDRSARILDLGCGYGAILSILRNAKYTDLSGVDGSPEQAAQARGLGFKNIHEGEIRSFLRGVPEGRYDVAIAFDVLEHFRKEELLDVVDEMRRVLAPGGRLILHVPNAEGIFCGSSHYHDLTHEMAFTRGNIHQIAGACRLKVVAIREDVPVVHGIRSLARFAIWTAGSFFFRLMTVAETGTGFRTQPLTRNLLAVLER